MRCAESILLCLALAASARADSTSEHGPPATAFEHHGHPVKHKAVVQPADARASLASQLAAETDTIDRAFAMVAAKLSELDAARARRVRAAYRVIDLPLAPDAGDAERMASARRRAATRVLLERDVTEHGLLAGESSHLRTARVRTVADAGRVPTIVLPAEIDRPTHGKIARRFGPLVHDRSGATLSRRGLDFEVDEHAVARAVADGVVTYAGPIRGLDRGVVIDHGDYTSVVAKLGELAIPVGAHVARGDRIGRAARHRVYLELRVKIGPGGLPIDPEPLLAR